MSLFGVTSNAQFRAGVSSGQIWDVKHAAVGRFPAHDADFRSSAFFNGDFRHAVIKGKVERRGGERHIKRNAVVVQPPVP